MGKNNFVYACARVRANERNLLSREKLNQMIDARTMEDACKVLQDAGYGEEGEVIQPLAYERTLVKESDKLYAFLHSLAPDAEEFRVFAYPFDYHNIKVLLKAEALGTDASSMLMSGGVLTPAQMEATVRERNTMALSKHMKTAIDEAVDTLSRTRDPQTVDLICDRECYADISEVAEKSGNRYLKGYVGLLIDTINLKTFVRARRMGQNWSYFESVCLPGGGISARTYVAGYDEALPQFAQRLAATALAKAAEEGGAAIKETDNPFHKYNKVKSLVLEPSKKELDELCQQGQVDFTFTYEAVYENGRKKGNPDKIMFHMEKGRMGLERDRVVKEHNQQQYLMNKLVERYEGLDIFELMPLVRRVPTDKFEALRDYCLKELPVLFEKAHRDRPANYVLTVIENWILALEKEQQEQEQQEQEARMQEIQEEAKVRWEGCRKIILQKVTNDESIRIFRSLRFEKFDLKEHALVLQVESRDDFDWLEQEVVIKQLLEPAIGKYFGKDSKLLYRIMKA